MQTSEEALFKDPSAKEEYDTSTRNYNMSAPIYDFAIANEGLTGATMEEYYPCCGKSIRKGCMYSFCKSGKIGT